MLTKCNIALILIVFTTGISCQKASSVNVNDEIVAVNTVETNTESQKDLVSKDGFPSLSCKMDGVLLEGKVPGVMIMYVPAKKEVNIRANTAMGVISMIIDNVEGAGTYTIKGTSNNGAGIMMSDKMYEVKKSGTLFTVTIESVEEIAAINAPGAKAISGTFQGQLMDNEGNIVEITEGKFSAQ